ncbi:hypothetical protein CSV63_00005 [Sporosarcina sp. P34]|uniref:hypothetical protein n=1 Tax=Sporosarcina sp. P34 TaxID=2048247 RepID=UPI000C16C8B5|nr:hypothetical protein [Sporosarcina sp. P34]PID16310.1 hypothetical protein CSV63_00005 [Sporosarcina sp. P34]
MLVMGWKLQLADAFLWARGEPTSSLRSLLVVSPVKLIHQESPLASASILLIKVGEVNHTLACGYEFLLALEIG